MLKLSGSILSWGPSSAVFISSLLGGATGCNYDWNEGTQTELSDSAAVDPREFTNDASLEDAADAVPLIDASIADVDAPLGIGDATMDAPNASPSDAMPDATSDSSGYACPSGGGVVWSCPGKPEASVHYPLSCPAGSARYSRQAQYDDFLTDTDRDQLCQLALNTCYTGNLIEYLGTRFRVHPYEGLCNYWGVELADGIRPMVADCQCGR